MTELDAHAPPKWEYRLLLKQTDRQMLLELNQIGRDGWEAFGLSYDKDLKGVMNWTCWVKRPVGVWSEPRPGTTPATTATPAAEGAEGVEAPKPGDVPGFDLPDGDFELRD